jgi:hypothetical protein
MPTFRIYYAEVGTKDGELIPADAAVAAAEFEDAFEADDPIRALELFFREHAPDRGGVAWVDDDGEAHPFEGWDYDPDQTYVWVENEKLMEYQGFDEATPGMVTCPLCNGHGEVEEGTADEFAEVWGDDEEEEESL